MVEILPFGKYKGKSVEQVCLNDYGYFLWLVKEVKNNDSDIAKRMKQSLRDRVLFVYKRANNFKSKKQCSIFECENIAKYFSVYVTRYSIDVNTKFIYCSKECFYKDPKVTNEIEKIEFLPLKMNSIFRIPRKLSKRDIKKLVDIIFKECMGLERGKRYSKEQLYEFFNRLSVWGELF